MKTVIQYEHNNGSVIAVLQNAKGYCIGFKTIGSDTFDMRGKGYNIIKHRIISPKTEVIKSLRSAMKNFNELVASLKNGTEIRCVK